MSVGPASVGFQENMSKSRFATDLNDVKVKGYTLFDLDARVSLDDARIKGTNLQLNALNQFNKHYFGSLSTQVNAFQILPPAFRAATIPTHRASRRERRARSWVRCRSRSDGLIAPNCGVASDRARRRFSCP